MYRDASIGVVVPAHNEAGFVGDVLDTIPSFVDRVYAVDDCSSDGTWDEIVSRATPEAPVATRADGGVGDHPGIVPLRHTTNRGRGAAVTTGYERALRDGHDIVVVMDGDGQMDPDQLDRLLDPLVDGRADYAKGTRLSRRAHWRGMSAWRLFGNALLTLLTTVASGYWGLRDSQNGYTAITADTLEDLDLDGLYPGYGFLNDVLVELNLRDARVIDVPMPAVYGLERSGIRYSTFIPSLSRLLLFRFAQRLRVQYLDGSVHPLVVLYSVGIGGLVLSGLGGLAALVRTTTRDRFVRLAAISLGALGLGALLDRRENRDLMDEDGPSGPP